MLLGVLSNLRDSSGPVHHIMGATARSMGDSVCMHSHTQAHTTCDHLDSQAPVGYSRAANRGLDGNREFPTAWSQAVWGLPPIGMHLL